MRAIGICLAILGFIVLIITCSLYDWGSVGSTVACSISLSMVFIGGLISYSFMPRTVFKITIIAIVITLVLGLFTWLAFLNTGRAIVDNMGKYWLAYILAILTGIPLLFVVFGAGHTLGGLIAYRLVGKRSLPPDDSNDDENELTTPSASDEL